ncbi:MAG: DUF3570 domain-containing protein, partial [Kiritimatiellaeota bacterium]|nr:DUF3570 domain-containing protein [Kiritimatiellota bacterium]
MGPYTAGNRTSRKAGSALKKLAHGCTLSPVKPPPDLRRLRFHYDKALVLALALNLLPLRRAAGGEDRLDFKTLIYKEDGDRMQIIAPTATLEKELTPTLTIRIEGIYNSISGASPTGAPPAGAAPGAAPSAPTSRGGGAGTAPQNTSSPVYAPPPPPPQVIPTPTENGGSEREADGFLKQLVRGVSGIRPLTQRFNILSGATTAPPAPAPAPAPPSSPSSPSAPSAPGSSASSSSSRSSSPAAPSAAAPGTAKAGSAPAPSSQPPSAPKVPTARANDQRYGLNVELIKNWGRHTAAAQVSYSEESDYWSRGLALRDAIDFNQKNTTLLVGVGANS